MSDQPISRRTMLKRTGMAAAGLTLTASGWSGRAAAGGGDKRPNIFFAISDDQSWLDVSIMGRTIARTPHFDRVAREGLLFTNAFCCAPSCSPSRAAILSGQDIWRLGAADSLYGMPDSDLPVYPRLLDKAGYHIGRTGKGWGPGAGGLHKHGWKHNPAGVAYQRRKGEQHYARPFERFLKHRPRDRPFCFWWGAHDPHRPYHDHLRHIFHPPIDPDHVNPPPFLPDAAPVRRDLANYYAQVAQFDRQLGRMLKVLEHAGELDNTIIVVTSDNGLPFPRAKATLYEYGTHMPLAIRWGRGVKGGGRVEAPVGFVDFAPTFLEAAGLQPPAEMTGKSLLPVLRSNGSASAPRDYALTAMERHTRSARPHHEGYPMRAMRTADYLYIYNFFPDRWPAGDPPKFADIDPVVGRGAPAKDYMMDHRDEPGVHHLFELAFGKRPQEELYDIRRDPANLHNLASDPKHTHVRRTMRTKLRDRLIRRDDPRSIPEQRPARPSAR